VNAVKNLGEIRCDVRSPEILRELAERPLPLALRASPAEHRFSVTCISTRRTAGCANTASAVSIALVTTTVGG
jgi:hypothetical protein